VSAALKHTFHAPRDLSLLSYLVATVLAYTSVSVPLALLVLVMNIVNLSMCLRLKGKRLLHLVIMVLAVRRRHSLQSCLISMSPTLLCHGCSTQRCFGHKSGPSPRCAAGIQELLRS
jgi:hypothetical protein